VPEIAPKEQPEADPEQSGERERTDVAALGEASASTSAPPEDEPRDRESRIYSAPFRIAGSRGSAVSLPDAPEDVDSIRPVADVLLAAAHADGKFCEREQATVRGLLCQLLGVEVLPLALEQQLADFDPARFDLADTLEALGRSSHANEERVLQLVRKVCEADETIDIREDNYMVALALALSVAPQRYAKLVVAESRGVNGRWKRIEDIVFGFAATLLFALPMLLIAIGIKLDSKGPVFFRQRRYGRGGTEIEVLKFRSMRVLEDGAVVTQATQGDARVTAFGWFLRRTSLDELPQLLNVLRGDMSLVGPRPHAVAHNELYRRQIVEYMLRHKVKPGITGWAQVNGWRGETDTLRKMVYRVEHDLEYIRRWSLWFDVKILWLTAFGRRVRSNAY
jgi:putative colanic acid biosynthesis UDP-glucose lipid carrier transferase